MDMAPASPLLDSTTSRLTLYPRQEAVAWPPQRCTTRRPLFLASSPPSALPLCRTACPTPHSWDTPSTHTHTHIFGATNIPSSPQSLLLLLGGTACVSAVVDGSDPLHSHWTLTLYVFMDSRMSGWNEYVQYLSSLSLSSLFSFMHPLLSLSLSAPLFFYEVVNLPSSSFHFFFFFFFFFLQSLLSHSPPSCAPELCTQWHC